MRRFVKLSCAFLIFSTIALAQSVEPIISWDVEVWAAGAVPATAQPIALLNFPKSGASCNLTPISGPPGPTVNPTRILIADPLNVGRECQLGILTAAALISTIPPGTGYFLTVRARGQTQISPRSAPSNNFDRAAAPPATTSTPKVLP